MADRKKRKEKMLYILKGIKNALICDVIAIVILTVIGSISALIRHTYIMRSVYMAYYFGGAFVLLIGVPQFYKRKEDPYLRRIRRLNPLYGFYDWFGTPTADKAMMEHFEEFKGDGFWLGLMMTLAGTVLLACGVFVENIFFK